MLPSRDQMPLAGSLTHSSLFENDAVLPTAGNRLKQGLYERRCSCFPTTLVRLPAAASRKCWCSFLPETVVRLPASATRELWCGCLPEALVPLSPGIAGADASRNR